MRHEVHRGQGARPEPSGSVAIFDPRRRDRPGWRLLEVVAEQRGVALPLLLHSDRCQAPIALSRQLAMYLMHVELSRTYQEVGCFFRRDRTTVSYACALIEDLREDVRFDAEVAAIAAALAAREPQKEALRVAV